MRLYGLVCKENEPNDTTTKIGINGEGGKRELGR